MTKNNSYLYSFFICLKYAGFSLGIEDYKLLLEVFRKEHYQFSNKEELLDLLKILWLKSPKDTFDFEQQFWIALREVPDNLIIPNPLKTHDLKGKDIPSKEFPLAPNTTTDKSKGDLQREWFENLSSHRDEMISRDEVAAMLSTFQRNDKFTEYVPQSIRENKSIISEYYPIPQRELVSKTRKIVKAKMESAMEELDSYGTLKSIYEKGFFLKPVFKLSEIKNHLTILTDISESMVAFESRAEGFFEKVARVQKVNRFYHKFYFNNLIEDGRIFLDKNYLNSIKLTKILSPLRTSKDTLIIISDAGAARGSVNPYRIDKTLDFLKKCQRITQNVIWLNPMPKMRWKGSTASIIASKVDMYSFRSQEISKALEKI